MQSARRFSGERLREAREARGLTAVSLAELAGVSRQAISQYENTGHTPRPDVLDKISSTLRLPQAFFYGPSRVQRDERLFFRSMAASTKTSRIRAGRRLLWLKDIVSYLRNFVELPRLNIPQFDIPEEFTQLSDHEIESLTARTRRHFGIGDAPISNVVWLLENNGVVVARDILGADTLDAFSECLIENAEAYIVLGADKNVSARSRFDAAHELGHLILHSRVPQKDLRRSHQHKTIESQAHRFAAAFLLPESSFSADYYSASLDAFRALKAKWKVSIAMMIRRAQDLKFISEQQARNLWVSYSRRGWRRLEPFDDEFEIEQPRLLLRAFELLFQSGTQDKQSVLNRLPYNAVDIETLSALSGHLSNLEISEPRVNLVPFPIK